MHSVRGALGSSKRRRHGRWPSSTPGPVLSVSSLCAEHIASAASSFFSRHRSFGSQRLRCEPTHNVSRSAGSIRNSSAPGPSGLPVLRRSAHRWLPVTAAQMQIRGCAVWRSSRKLVAMQFVSSSTVGSASHQAAQAHLRSQREPNPSVKRTCLRHAAYLKR